MSKYYKTKATIIKAKPHYLYVDREEASIEYEYIVGNKTYAGHGYIPKKVAIKQHTFYEEIYIGKPVSILYEKDNPSNSLTVYDKNKYNPIVIIILLGFTLLSGLLVYK